MAAVTIASANSYQLPGDLSMSELRFDGRVAVITGAGRGLGRAYALLLAARGAKVVVNDPGASLKGDGLDGGPAQQVVQKSGLRVAKRSRAPTRWRRSRAVKRSSARHWITSVASISSFTTPASFVARRSKRSRTTTSSRCSTFICAARFTSSVRRFPLMCKAGYGRIVLTSSINGLYGNKNVVNYCVAKAGIIGLVECRCVGRRG